MRVRTIKGPPGVRRGEDWCIEREGVYRKGRGKSGGKVCGGELERKKRAGRTALEIARGNRGADYSAHSPFGNSR